MIHNLKNRSTGISADIDKIIIDPETGFHKYVVTVKRYNKVLSEEEFYCKAYARRHATTQVFAPILM